MRRDTTAKSASVWAAFIVLLGILLMHGAVTNSVTGCHESMESSTVMQSGQMSMDSSNGATVTKTVSAVSGNAAAASSPSTLASNNVTADACVSREPRAQSFLPSDLTGVDFTALFVVLGLFLFGLPRTRSKPYRSLSLSGRTILLRVCIARV